MKKYTLLFVTIIGLQLGLVGCTTQPTPVEQQSQESQRLLMVSSGNPSDVLPAFETFTWSEDYNRVLSAIPGHDDQESKAYIREQIIEYMETKGYRYEPDPAKANIVIGFLFALEDAIADQEIQQRFGVLPGLQRATANDPRYKKGSFILAALNNQEKVIYWRSAVQGFVDLEEDRADSTRMQAILGMMLGDFPIAGH